MTYLFKNPRTCEDRMRRRVDAYFNVWQLANVDGLHSGDAHWSREAAEKAMNDNRFEASQHPCLYRVVVRWKQ